MAWTKDQELAINEDGTNIIVSAGAGSGKTAVLSERVLQKVLSGVHIDELLIMTFTNAAAKEMKERIRKKLKENNLDEEVSLVDSSYITTFDSFSLSIVKKYHYLQNIPKSINITDQSLLDILKEEVMDEVFESFYTENSKLFKNFISDFCVKDDKELKKLLLKLNDSLDMRLDKEEYLENYIDNRFNDKKIDEDIELYFKEIKYILDDISINMEFLTNSLDQEHSEKFYGLLTKLIYSKNYDEVVKGIPTKLPLLPRELDDEDIKKAKDKISDDIKMLKEMCIYTDTSQIKKEILSTKEYVSLIIKIVNEFSNLYDERRKEHGMFSFMDISKLAIKLVEENDFVRDELRNKFNEIMLDEYQDTNDIQEYFVSLISKNNVYMVGDIKQSIYRFRNANPYIFKNKYDKYSNHDNGTKIDLLKNFRSREEVLSDINLVFDDLMDDNLGGADYKKSHRMVFGNKTYNEEGKTDEDYNLEIMSYDSNNDDFKNNEIEIFTIGNDILKKINNDYIVFDKDTGIKRKALYSDFVILLDRSSDFSLYKKIFEYLNIPLSVYKDEEITNDYDILIIKNILKIIRAIDKEKFDQEFLYAFLSVGRSFLFQIEDRVLFNYLYESNFRESIIYKKCEELYNYYYDLSPKVFYLKLLDIFNVEEKLLTIGDIEKGRIRFEYFYNLISSFEDEKKTIEDFIDYLDTIFENSFKSSFSLNENESNSVKIMTIHKSKGLEYPICYFAGFKKSFSFRELNDTILYSNKFGIIIPYFNGYVKDTIYKTLLKLNTKEEEVSEKIRLLYVAFTRAKEKMIIVTPELDKEKYAYNVSYLEKRKIKSFFEMMCYVYKKIEKYIKTVEINCSKDYLKNHKDLSSDGLSSSIKIDIDDLEFEDENIDEEKFSKSELSLISVEDFNNMNFGTRIHQILEYIDFKNPKYESLSKMEEVKVRAFIESSLIRENIDNKFYKEYEFCYLIDNVKKHGIIDLLIENDDSLILVDYKLKNISDPSYDKQLNGYRKYLEKVSKKEVSMYLYSIMDQKFRKVDKKNAN